MDSTKRNNGGRNFAPPEKNDSIALSTAVDSAHSNSVRLSAEDVRAEKRASLISANHEWDPNLPSEKRQSLQEAIRQHDVEAERAIVATSFEEDSPYPEVRAAVRNYDEDVPAATFRAFFIGLVLATVASGLNMLFSMRNPPITVSVLVAQLVAYPIGKGWAAVMPRRVFNIFGYSWTLNPGPFNMKEHTIIVVMANASMAGGVAYSTDTLLAQIVRYKQDFGWGFALLYTISLQCIGFGMAGICRKFLVWPAAMIWPSNLVNTTLFYTLHKNEKPNPAETHGWSISRYRWFLYLGLAGALWYFIPGYMFTALSTFTWPIIATPNNVIVNQIFGASTGLGLMPITFDWNFIGGYIGSPLPVPFHALASVAVGLTTFFLILTPALHYSNAWNAQYFPIMTAQTYDNRGQAYNITKILTPELTLDPVKYKAYSPLFISTAFAVAYGLSFAGIAATVTHVALFHGKEIMNRFKTSREEDEDVHMRLMKKYKEVPQWQYAAVFLVMFGMGMAAMVAYPTHLTWWAFTLSIIIAAIFLIPVGIIMAITNIQIGLNVITEFIIGYIQPGKPVAMMTFKSFGYISMSQALYFVQDLKLGHYMKVPPRAIFWAQGVAAVWTAIVQIAVMYWALGNIPGACTPEAKLTNRFTCPNANTYYSASVIWGLLGPGRIFSPGQIYSALLWFFFIGAITPVIVWLLARKFPNGPWRYINMPVLFSGTGNIPPATPFYYITWCGVGMFFNGFLRRRKFGWWKTYNYITSASLDLGLFLGLAMVFFFFQMPKVEFPAWWGNTVLANTLDGSDSGTVRVTIPEGSNSTFGPKTWS